VNSNPFNDRGLKRSRFDSDEESSEGSSSSSEDEVLVAPPKIKRKLPPAAKGLGTGVNLAVEISRDELVIQGIRKNQKLMVEGLCRLECEIHSKLLVTKELRYWVMES
jgi:hypothetical protein